MYNALHVKLHSDVRQHFRQRPFHASNITIPLGRCTDPLVNYLV